MRYIPQSRTPGVEAWSPYRRPPLDQLPADIAAACREIDTLAEQMHKAAAEVAALKNKELDDAAKNADQADAIKAARSGKSMPPAKHRDALAAKRDDAKRRHEALVGALDQAITEANEKRWSHDTDAARTKVVADHAARREEMLAKAAELTDLLDAATAERAVADWYHTGAYQSRPITWWADLHPDLANLGVGRDTAGTVNVRDVISGAITAVMEEPTP